MSSTRIKKHDYICTPCANAANRLYKKGERPPKTNVYRDKPVIPLIDRLLAKTKIADGCWIWQGGTAKGYGVIGLGRRRDGKQRNAHIVSYEYFVGRPVPEGMELDHLCRVRRCINPAHLEPVTHQENALRGIAPSAIAARTNRCQSGRHELSSNAYTHPKTGKRRCEACRREKRRADYAAQKLRRMQSLR